MRIVLAPMETELTALIFVQWTLQMLEKTHVKKIQVVPYFYWKMEGTQTNNSYGYMLWYIKMSNNQIFCYCYRNTLVGVTSFGSGCGDPDYPGVYARVTEVKQWIQATVSGTQDSNCNLE